MRRNRSSCFRLKIDIDLEVRLLDQNGKWEARYRDRTQSPALWCTVGSQHTSPALAAEALLASVRKLNSVIDQNEDWIAQKKLDLSSDD
jgi:hypothetical protein